MRVLVGYAVYTYSYTVIALSTTHTAAARIHCGHLLVREIDAPPPPPRGRQSLLSFVVISRYLPTYLPTYYYYRRRRSSANRSGGRDLIENFQLQNSNTLTENIRFERLRHNSSAYTPAYSSTRAPGRARVYRNNKRDGFQDALACHVGRIRHTRSLEISVWRLTII